LSHFTIAYSRKSAFALWQAEHVKALLEQRGHQVHLLGIDHQGRPDPRIRSLSKVGGKGLFVKELETALEGGPGRPRGAFAEGRADGPARRLRARLRDGARGPARRPGLQPSMRSLADLPQGAVVGTSSLRRVCCCARCART
jgi:hydroxymethylbilane synthase